MGIGRRIAICIALGLMMIQAGCWSAREISQLAFVLYLGIDSAPEGEGLIVSFRIADPLSADTSDATTSAGSGAQPTFPIVIKAQNLTEAVESLRHMIPKTPVLNHLQALFVGEELAKKGVREVLEFAERDPETRRNVNFVIVRGQSAAELFTAANPRLESSIGISIRLSSVINNAPEVTLSEFVSLLHQDGIDAFAPAVSLVPSVAPFPGLPPEERPLTSPTEIRVAGAALFHEDRIVGTLDEIETRALQILQNSVIHRSITFRGDDVSGAVRILHSKSTIRVNLKDGLPEYEIKVNINARTTEVITRRQVNEETARIIEAAVAATVTKEIEDLIAYLQSVGSDPIGLGRLVHMHYPAVWHELRDHWLGVYGKLTPRVSVVVSIQDMGAVTRSISIPSMEPRE